MKIRVFVFSALCSLNLQAQQDTTAVFEERELDYKILEYCGQASCVQSYFNGKIDYPKKALANGVEGMLTFSFVLSEKGEMSDVKILQDPGGGCGEMLLQKNGYSRCYFWPHRNGKQVKARLVRHLKFSLADTSITYHITHPDMNGPFQTLSEWTSENRIFDMFDLSKPASFRGGERELFLFFIKELKLDGCKKDSLNAEEKAVVSFVVNKDGSLEQIKMLKSPHPCISDAIVAAVSRMPRWNLAEANGCPARMKMILPIRVRLE